MARNINRKVAAPNRPKQVSLEEQVLGVSALSDDEKFLFGQVVQAAIPLINNVSSIHEIAKKEVLFRTQTLAAIDMAFMFVDSYRQRMNEIANYEDSV
jgi:hypothetical protein